MSSVAISVKGVSKCYQVFENQRSRLLHSVYPRYTNGMDEIWALKDINFEIKCGESVAIIGQNGCGKSTLLEILTGTLTPTSGSVKVNGRVSSLLELGSGFHPEYSGRDNVILNGLILGLRKDEILNRFAEIEAFAEIGLAIDRPVKTYSSGMMIRLAFAVQVLCDPSVLIIDEALSVGDFFFQQKCFSYIKRLKLKGVTLLFVSHDMATVRDLCTRGIFLRKGCVSFDGEQTEAIRNYFNFAKETNIEDIRQVVSTEQFPQYGSTKIELKDPIWYLSDASLRDKKNLKAHLIAVTLTDTAGSSINKIQIGSDVIFRVHYRVFSEEPVHVHLVLKNKYGHIITATGSLNLKILPPKLELGQDAFFELQINLSIEAGDYVFSLSLNQLGAHQIGGVLIDQTPWIGPIQVLWNYAEKIPPFFGVCGMTCSAYFSTNMRTLVKG